MLRCERMDRDRAAVKAVQLNYAHLEPTWGHNRGCIQGVGASIRPLMPLKTQRQGT